MIPSLDVHLSQPPSNRWVFSPAQVNWAQALVDTTLAEIGGVEPYRELIELYASNYVSDSFVAEFESISKQCGRPYLNVLTANLYYDFVKLLLGCTAFAVNTSDGPIHARNMDWFSNSHCLSEFTTITSYQSDYPFQSVGWPGFAGVFSGIAPGRFTITMNAALSNEPQIAGASIALLIREVLESCSDFDSAVDVLATTTINSDCLLLLTGPEADQMLVIERTPTKHAYRYPIDGQLILTNDFRVLPQPKPETDSPLYSSTCSRYDSVCRVLDTSPPLSLTDCFAILSETGVRMSITVQQMVMSARTGELLIRTQHTDS